MDCATFCRQHAGFVDGAISDVDLVSMQRHIAECASCAAHDVAVRRALVVFRSLPPIDVSPDFTERLHGRLRRARTERRRSAWFGRAPHRGPGIATFAAMASGVIAAGFVVVSAFGWGAPISALTLAPVVASAPSVNAPVFASAPTTMAPVAERRVAAAPVTVASKPAAMTYGRIIGVGNPAFGRGAYPARWSPPPAASSVESIISSGMPVWSEPPLDAPPMVRGAASLELTNLRR